MAWTKGGPRMDNIAFYRRCGHGPHTLSDRGPVVDRHGPKSLDQAHVYDMGDGPRFECCFSGLVQSEVKNG